jgi:hypothetical protein
MNSAEQLQRIYLAGFELQTFDRFPKCVGVIRDGCIALLVPGVDGLQVLGTPGWRMGEVIGVLTEIEGRKAFQAKTEVLEATAERLAALERFREDLMEILKAGRENGPAVETRMVNGFHTVVLPEETAEITSEHVKRVLEDDEAE